MHPVCRKIYEDSRPDHHWYEDYNAKQHCVEQVKAKEHQYPEKYVGLQDSEQEQRDCDVCLPHADVEYPLEDFHYIVMEQGVGYE